MKIEYRYDKVPCFGRNPKVDVELMKRIRRNEEGSSDWRPSATAWVAIATSAIAFIIFLASLLQYC